IIQSFYRDINDDRKSISLDNLGIIVGFLFFIVATVYSRPTISILYGNEYLSSSTNLMILGAAALISSILTTGSPKLMLLKKDHEYFTSYVISATVSIATTICLSYTSYANHGISIGIFLGELCLFLLFTKYLGGKKHLYPRLVSTSIYIIYLGVILYLTSFLNLPYIYTLILTTALFGVGALYLSNTVLNKLIKF